MRDNITNILGYREWLKKALSDPDQAVAYVQVAIDQYQRDKNLQDFLSILEIVLCAQSFELSDINR